MDSDLMLRWEPLPLPELGAVDQAQIGAAAAAEAAARAADGKLGVVDYLAQGVGYTTDDMAAAVQAGAAATSARDAADQVVFKVRSYSARPKGSNWLFVVSPERKGWSWAAIKIGRRPKRHFRGKAENRIEAEAAATVCWWGIQKREAEEAAPIPGEIVAGARPRPSLVADLLARLRGDDTTAEFDGVDAADLQELAALLLEEVARREEDKIASRT